MKKVLLIRNDKIGDFALNWPLFQLFKKHDENISIYVAVSPVVAPLARICPYIDQVFMLSDDSESLVARVRSQQIDIAICYGNAPEVKLLPAKAGIPIRIGASCGGRNHLLTKAIKLPKQYDKHTWQDCFVYLKAAFSRSCNNHHLSWPLWNLQKERARWRTYYNGDHRLVLMVHPGTGGSAAVYPVEQYVSAIYIAHGSARTNFKVIVSWYGDELADARVLVTQLQARGVDAELMLQHNSLAGYARSLVAVDIMLACSTGPLHLAGLHNVFTIGLYGYKRAIRWQNLSFEERRVSLCVPHSFLRNRRRDISRISPENIALALNNAMKHLDSSGK